MSNVFVDESFVTMLHSAGSVTIIMSAISHVTSNCTVSERCSHLFVDHVHVEHSV
jgi:hypothetical protein